MLFDNFVDIQFQDECFAGDKPVILALSHLDPDLCIGHPCFDHKSPSFYQIRPERPLEHPRRYFHQDQLPKS